MLLGVIGRINRALSDGSDYSAVRFAILVMALIANFAESNFACMTPLGLLFILAAIGQARPETVPAFAYPPGFSSAAESEPAPGTEAPADRMPQVS